MKVYLCTAENRPQVGALRDLELPYIKKKRTKKAELSNAVSSPFPPLPILSTPQLFPRGLITHPVRDIKNRRNTE